MTGSYGRLEDCIWGEDKFLPPPIIGDRGLSMPAADGGRPPPTTEPERGGRPPSAEPTTDPETEPETEEGSGTRAARFVYDP